MLSGKSALGVAAVGILLLAVANVPALLPNRPETSAESLASRQIPADLRSGDVIFRRGTSAVRDAVLWLDAETPYSHVGIVYVGNRSGPQVIHAEPGTELLDLEPVKVESFTDFIAEDGTTAFTVQRFMLDSGSQIASAAAGAALGFARDKVAFDGGFSLDSADAMYCTELVWRAFSAVGVDLISGGFDEIQAPFLSKQVIFASTLLNSPFLEEIHSVSLLSGEQYE